MKKQQKYLTTKYYFILCQYINTYRESHVDLQLRVFIHISKWYLLLTETTIKYIKKEGILHSC